MWRIAGRLMARSWRTLVPAGIAVAIGAMLVCASLLAGGVFNDAAMRPFTLGYGDAGYSAAPDAAAGECDSSQADDTGHFPCTLDGTGLARIGDADGVADSRYGLETDVAVAAPDGQTRTMHALEASERALEASRQDTIMPFELAEGAWPSVAGQVAIDEEAATVLELTVGSTVTVGATTYGNLSGRRLTDSDSEAGSGRNGGNHSADSGPGDGSETDGTRSIDSDDGGNPLEYNDSMTETEGMSQEDLARISQLADRTVTATVTGILHDQNNLYATNGGALVTAPDDMLTLVKAYNAAATLDASLLDTIEGWTHGDLPAATVYFSINPGTDPQTVLSTVNATLNGATAVTRQEAADRQMRSLTVGGVNPVVPVILWFAAIAMFIAALVIANTFRVLVAQRRRTFALLHTIGASSDQVKRCVLDEGIALGVVWSLAGVALTYGAGGIVNAAHISVNDTPIRIHPSPASVIVTVVFATAVTALASLHAGSLATQVSPMEALQPVEATEAKHGSRTLAVWAAVLLSTGLAASVVCLVLIQRFAQNPTAHDTTLLTALVSLGSILSFLGLVMLAGTWMPWLLSGLGRLAARTGPAALIADANIRRNPHRVAATGTALLIGVTLMATVASTASCAQASLDRIIERYSVDAELTGDSLTQPALNYAKNLDGVKDAALVPFLNGWWDAGGGSGTFTGLAGPVYIVPDSIIGNEVRDAFGTRSLQDGTIYVSRDYQGGTGSVGKGFRLADGQMIDVTFTSGALRHQWEGDNYTVSVDSNKPRTTMTLTVKLADFGLMSSSQGMVISQETAAQLGIEPAGAAIWIVLDTTLPEAELTESMDALQQAYPDCTLTGAFTTRQTYERAITVVRQAQTALLGVAVLIALVGVANTLSLSVIERRRESATLRAIGMTAGQLTASLVWEAALICVGAGIVGLLFGAFYGWTGAAAVLSGLGLSAVFAPDWAMGAVIFALALVTAIISSIAPAHRTLKTPPVAALADAD